MKTIALFLILMSLSICSYAMDDVTEQSSWFVEISFFDQNKAPVVPSSITYSIYDISGALIRGPIDVTPSSSTYEIEILPAENAILNPADDVEIRVVTINFKWGIGRARTDEYRYRLKNLDYIQ